MKPRPNKFPQSRLVKITAEERKKNENDAENNI